MTQERSTNEQKATAESLLACVYRRLQNSTNDAERATILEWAIGQGAKLDDVRDVFDSWENQSRRRRHPGVADRSNRVLPGDEQKACEMTDDADQENRTPDASDEVQPNE